jgi:hypothetical protein
MPLWKLEDTRTHAENIDGRYASDYFIPKNQFGAAPNGRQPKS